MISSLLELGLVRLVELSGVAIVVTKRVLLIVLGPNCSPRTRRIDLVILPPIYRGAAILSPADDPVFSARELTSRLSENSTKVRNWLIINRP